MRIPLFQVDAFTPRPFAGNPAAVCLLEAPLDTARMQAIGAENNLSETAFLVPPGDPGGAWSLRWFTPTVEVPLCGHATLASAHVLFETGRAGGDALRFATASGELGATREDGWVRLDFPALACQPRTDPPANLGRALGTEPVEVHHVVESEESGNWVVVLADAAAVRALAPDHAALATLGLHGVIVTALADDADVDFVSRYFAPGAGIPEDPVTGSTHCALAPFWGARLERQELTGYQASARGGVVRCRVRGERVHLLGQAVTVIEGELTLPEE